MRVIYNCECGCEIIFETDNKGKNNFFEGVKPPKKIKCFHCKKIVGKKSD